MTESYDQNHHPGRRRDDQEPPGVHVHCHTYISIDVGGISRVDRLVVASDSGASDTDKSLVQTKPDTHSNTPSG